MRSKSSISLWRDKEDKRRDYMYLKVLRDDLKENGHVFRKGINTDEAGILFTDGKHITNYLGIGNKIAEIIIPDEEPVTEVKEGYIAHKIILEEIKTLWSANTLKWMIDNGLDIHANKEFVLWQAVRNNSFESVQYLVQKGANPNIMMESMFTLAAAGGYLDIMKLLKEYDRYHQINYHDALRRASYAGHLDSVKYLVESGITDIHFDEDIALRSAVSNNQFEVVRYLIEAGADIHVKDERPLQTASAFGNMEIVKYLIESGAKILPGEDGAMGWAGRNGHLDVLNYFAEIKGEIPEGSDYALVYASENGYLEAVDYLLGLGVDAHGLNELALKSAVRKGHLNVVGRLIEAGADVHQDDDEAIFLAVINNRYDILNFFQEIGYPIKGSLKRAARWESAFISI